MEYYRLKFFNSFSRIWFVCVKGLVSIYLIFILFACSSLRTIEIETAVLPQFPISDEVQSLALLNRSMTRQFTNLSSDSLEKILVNHKMVMDTVFRDSIAADTVIHIAAQALFNSGRFDVVVPSEYRINRDDSGDILNPLKTDIIQQLCIDYKVDGILILEGFNEQLKIKYDYRPLTAGGGFDGSADVDYKSEWRLYRPESNKPAIRFQVGDSIFWKSDSFELNDLYLQMPHTKEALIGGGIASGLKMAEYISPGWVKHTRYYFLTRNKEIDYAGNLIKENKWDEAADLWAKYAKENSKKIRSKVEFNLALTEEMKGDLDLAIEWGLKSYNTSYSNVTEEYLKILDATRKAKQKESKQRF